MNIETCKFVAVSGLIPETWKDWFFPNISDSAPFSWGDNNRTMITKDRFLDHIEPILIDVEVEGDVEEEEREAFVRSIELIPPDVYIDMEN